MPNSSYQLLLTEEFGIVQPYLRHLLHVYQGFFKHLIHHFIVFLALDYAEICLRVFPGGFEESMPKLVAAWQVVQGSVV